VTGNNNIFSRRQFIKKAGAAFGLVVLSSGTLASVVKVLICSQTTESNIYIKKSN
jgi:hypothetical protein